MKKGGRRRKEEDKRRRSLSTVVRGKKPIQRAQLQQQKINASYRQLDLFLCTNTPTLNSTP